ncbi:MAG: MFS transporter [Xanthomonadales bacterium]|nr:MFS transporter [Xanthomonadales bacterium]
MSRKEGYDRRRALAWAMYDWGNSAFATSVMAAFFPIFLGDYWLGESKVNSTFVLGTTNSASGLIVMLSAPLLGAIADRMSARKGNLLLFAVVGATSTAALTFLQPGQWLAAAVLFGIAAVGFSAANIFYDALLVGVAPPPKRDFVSSLGFAAGYLGGSLLFIVHALMINWPEWFGLQDRAMAVRVSFLTVAVWWVVFTIPLLLRVPEPPGVSPARGWQALRSGLAGLASTLRQVKAHRPVLLFLVGYWLYIDGVHTIIRMALDFGRQIGFGTSDLVLALLITNLVGFPATLGFGRLGERIGSKAGILLALGVYCAVALSAWFIDRVWHFYVLAVAIGLVQGGVQSLSRSFYSRIIPQDKSAEFFGFYNMLGKFAVVLGPFVVGGVSVLTGSPRVSIMSVLVFFVVGGAILAMVREGK